MNWSCKHTWRRASNNTLWCLIGCSIGDFGTIFYFQNIEHSWTVSAVMALAIINGLITSIILETIILAKQMTLKEAFKVAIGMSFISMVAFYLQKYVVYRKRKIYVGGKTFDELADVMLKYKDENYLLPGSNVLSKRIEDKLNEIEVKWTKGVFYNTVISDLSDLKNVYYDVLVFFSPSGIESLFKNFPDFEQNNTRIAVFGKNTAKAATDAGLNINIEAPLPKVRSMSEALDLYIAKANKAKS